VGQLADRLQARRDAAAARTVPAQPDSSPETAVVANAETRAVAAASMPLSDRARGPFDKTERAAADLVDLIDLGSLFVPAAAEFDVSLSLDATGRALGVLVTLSTSGQLDEAPDPSSGPDPSSEPDPSSAASDLPDSDLPSEGQDVAPELPPPVETPLSDISAGTDISGVADELSAADGQHTEQAAATVPVPGEQGRTVSSVMEINVFSAPRDSGSWSAAAAQISGTLRRDGATVDVLPGPFGVVLAVHSPPLAPGLSGPTVLICGVDGPGWLLRFALRGLAVVDEAVQAALVGYLLRVVVNRGPEPTPVGALLPLTIPTAPTATAAPRASRFARLPS
jgi:hypothetical protein